MGLRGHSGPERLEPSWSPGARAEDGQLGASVHMCPGLDSPCITGTHDQERHVQVLSLCVLGKVFCNACKEELNSLNKTVVMVWIPASRAGLWLIGLGRRL